MTTDEIAQATAKGQLPRLGFGLLRPFVRDQKNDFAAGGGVALVTACVGQVLGTRASSPGAAGELPWRPRLGTKLQRLRHKNNKPLLAELARLDVAEALRRYEPRARVRAVERTELPSRRGFGLVVVFDVVSQGGTTLATGQRVLVDLGEG